MKIVKIVLEGERPKSLNHFYAGVHWTKRKAEADRVHLLVRAAIDPQEVKVFDCPVDIIITSYFKNRPLDASNIFVKLYEDGLIGWVIRDDSPKYVRSVKSVSLVDKDNPRVEIEVHAA